MTLSSPSYLPSDVVDFLVYLSLYFKCSQIFNCNNCNNKDMWSRNFNYTGNRFSILLANLFSKYDKKQISLEMARDKVRKELGKVFPHLKFGSYTSIEYILDAMFTTGEVIYKVLYHFVQLVSHASCRLPNSLIVMLVTW